MPRFRSRFIAATTITIVGASLLALECAAQATEARASQHLKHQRPMRQRSEAAQGQPGVAGRLSLALRVECGALLD